MLQSIPYKKAFVGSDVFIIGGGPSLREFDWSRLEGRNTIGCNAAFKLGRSICNLCFFSDIEWFRNFRSDLDAYPGSVATHSPELHRDRPVWLHWMPRGDAGLHLNALGGANAGAGAVNLALLMGAKRVFLLGFDCKLSPAGISNWHEHVIEPANAAVYPHFIEEFRAIAHGLPIHFPGTEIINLNPDSELDCFRKEKPELFL